MIVTRLVVDDGRKDTRGRVLTKSKLYVSEFLEGEIDSFYRLKKEALREQSSRPCSFTTCPASKFHRIAVSRSRVRTSTIASEYEMHH